MTWAKIADAAPLVPPHVRLAVLARDERRCTRCCALVGDDNLPLFVVVDEARPADAENVTLRCASCAAW